MRAVLDTNILARPPYGVHGPAAELYSRLTRAPHVLVTSTFILRELHRFLRYPRMRSLHQWNDEKIDAYIAGIESSAFLVTPTPESIVSIVTADPDDDHVVATAVLANADVLCTLNRHMD